MFGFNKKKFTPSVTYENKAWVENNFLWFIEIFGLEHLKEGPFILPTVKIFPYDNLNDREQFQKLFIQLCQFWQLNPEQISIEFFDDLKSKEWIDIAPEGSNSEPSGIYFRSYSSGEKPFNIQLAKIKLQHTQLLIAVISHELAHVKLLGGEFSLLIEKCVTTASQLANLWINGDGEEKKMFQNILFPEGIIFDKEIDDYRTSNVNVVIELIAELSAVYTDKKKGIVRRKFRTIPVCSEDGS